MRFTAHNDYTDSDIVESLSDACEYGFIIIHYMILVYALSSLAIINVRSVAEQIYADHAIYAYLQSTSMDVLSCFRVEFPGSQHISKTQRTL